MISHLSSVARQFGTNWFTIVMGVGIVAALTYTSPVAIPGLQPIGVAFFLLANLLFILALGLWSWRWIYHTDEALKDFSDPGKILFYGALAMSILVMGNNFLLIGLHILTPTTAILISKTLWLCGVVVAPSLYSLLHLTKKESKIPFSLGWWSYVFPLGSFTTGTYALNGLLGHSFFAVAGFIQFIALIGFFSLVWCL